ncbi:SurA N-terminal domain-containing protein [Sphingomonas daechungensis]|uniref:SurA N-terminal domain-containing protein n=1 Tax=Sphingomonas daechungensis TaxID=1176646 RepID=UPI0037840503
MRSKIVLAVSLALLASACNKKAEGQTVAVVNGEEITATELNAELGAAKLPDGVDKDQARARVLQAMVDRRLLAQQAKADGIDKSPEFLNRQRKMTEELLINMFASRQTDSAQLPTAADIEKYQASHPWVFANRELWSLDQVRFAMPTDSALRKQLADAKTLDEVLAVLTKAGIQFTRQKNRLDTAVIPQNIYGQLTTIGTEPFIIPVGDQAVASVIIGREPAPLTGDKAKSVAVSSMRRDKTNTTVQDRLKAARDSAKIEYKEGFAPPATTPAAKK